MELSLKEVVYANSVIIDRFWELENEGTQNEEHEILGRLVERMVDYINTAGSDDFVNAVWI